MLKEFARLFNMLRVPNPRQDPNISRGLTPVNADDMVKGKLHIDLIVSDPDIFSFLNKRPCCGNLSPAS